MTAGTVFRGGLLGLLLCAGMLATGCARRGDAPFGLNGDAEVRLSLGVDHSENEQVVSRTAMPQIDPHKDLAVYVINTHEDTLARWASFDDVPSVLRFTPGAYKVVAEYRPAGARVPDFDTYIYRAEEKFVIKAKDDLHINLVARLATVKISVEFDSNFDFFYQSYSVDIRTVGKDSLRFVDGETRCGFFEPGSVRMRFNLVTREGRRLVFSPAPLAKAQAADAYTLKLRVASDQGNVSGIIITTDDAMNPDKEVWVEVPKYFLPKDKPTIAPTGFVSGVSQSVFEGSVAKWSVAAEAQGGVSSFVIRLEDGPAGVLGTKLGAALEGKSEIDLASLPEEAPLRRALREAGFVWSAGLNSPEDAAIATSVWVDFSGAMRAREDGSAAVYDFSFAVTDNYDQQPDVDHPCAVKAEVRAPTVKFIDIETGNIWATRAFFTVQANYDLNTGTHPMVQYRKTSSQNWIDTEEGTNGDVIVTALNGGAPDASGFYAAQYELRGLQAATEYEFRVLANERAVSPVQPVWTTERKLSVPGIGADGSFAAGWNEAAATTALGVTVQAPPAGWATRNALTTSQRALSTDPNTGSGTVAWSEVSANNGTLLVPSPGDYNRKAVQLRTTGWGQGSYSKADGDNAGSFFSGGGSPALGARVRNTSAAILYLGAYSASSLGDASETWEYYAKSWSSKTKVTYPYETFQGETVAETGAAFASRPATLNFQYTFTPSTDGSPKEFLVRAEVYATDGTKIGGVVWNNGAAVTNMTNRTLEIDYTVLDKPAAVLKLFFSSDVRWESVGTPNGGPDYTMMRNGDPHIGNVLVIDRVTLGYDFE